MAENPNPAPDQAREPDASKTGVPDAPKTTGPDPVKDPETAGEPRSAGTGGPGGANAPESTDAENVLTEDDVRAEAERQMRAYEDQVKEGKASRYALAEMMTQTPADEYEVIVDEWGHTPKLVRGQRFTADNCPYDLRDALDRGIVRQLNIAEVRSMTPHPTLPLTGDGLAVDDALIMAGRFHAGFRSPAITGVLSDPDGNPVTVTTTSPPEHAERPELTKSSVPVVPNNGPAGRPVIVIEPGQDPRSAVEDYFADQERQAKGATAPAKGKSGNK